MSPADDHQQNAVPFPQQTQAVVEMEERISFETGSVQSIFQQEMMKREFATLEEAHAFAAQLMRINNQSPYPDFEGLSPEQMYHMNHQPYESPRIVVISEVVESPDAPVTQLFQYLVEAIGDNGLKPTAKGNLPRNFSRDAALKLWGEDEYKKRTELSGINSEEDFEELHVMRITAELAGLIRIYKGKFILSRDCRAMLHTGGLTTVYPALLRAFTGKYNWGYPDNYPEFHIIQQSWMYTLFLLKRYGEELRHQSFFEKKFLTAFPMIEEEAILFEYASKDTAANAYALRSFNRFTQFFGLTDLRPVSDTPYCLKNLVKTNALLDRVVSFDAQLLSN